MKPPAPRTRIFLLLGLAGTLGLFAGVGGYTFYYAHGLSYFSNDPRACVNCHVMRDHFDGWLKSPHHAVATCNDCHTPHDFIGKYYTKASHGFWHSYYFTTNTFHEPIQIGETSRQVTEESCRYCHQPMVDSITVSENESHFMQVSCIRCHRNVGHQH